MLSSAAWRHRRRLGPNIGSATYWGVDKRQPAASSAVIAVVAHSVELLDESLHVGLRELGPSVAHHAFLQGKVGVGVLG